MWEDFKEAYIKASQRKAQPQIVFIVEKGDKMEGLVEGRVVHFVLYNSHQDENYKHQGEVITCRPAIIVNAWGGKLGDGIVNLQVFLDGSNDYDYDIVAEYKSKESPLILWKTSVKYSETKEIGTWHWPERN